eukprot:Rhum_TRINITY_DN5181_c0_g1::Rhum_TRINITY_DN5181_c0_g1_i1::g.16729::m.16729
MLRRFVVRLAPSIRPPPGSEGAAFAGRKISEEQRAAVGESLQDNGLSNLSQAERRALEEKHRTEKNAEHAADARAKRERRDSREAVSIHRGSIRSKQVEHAQLDASDIIGSHDRAEAARVTQKHQEGSERAAREFRHVGATKKQFLKKKVEDDDDLF